MQEILPSLSIFAKVGMWHPYFSLSLSFWDNVGRPLSLSLKRYCIVISFSLLNEVISLYLSLSRFRFFQFFRKYGDKLPIAGTEKTKENANHTDATGIVQYTKQPTVTHQKKWA